MSRDEVVPHTGARVLAGGWPRFGALVYDGLLLFGLGFIASWVFVILSGDARAGVHRIIHQLYLATVFGAYFVSCWRRSGQTLGMKTWGVRLVDADGGPISMRRGVLRYVLALAGLSGAAAGFLWAFADRDRQFLHDRILGTRLIRAPI